MSNKSFHDEEHELEAYLKRVQVDEPDDESLNNRYTLSRTARKTIVYTVLIAFLFFSIAVIVYIFKHNMMENNNPANYSSQKIDAHAPPKRESSTPEETISRLMAKIQKLDLNDTLTYICYPDTHDVNDALDNLSKSLSKLSKKDANRLKSTLTLLFDHIKFETTLLDEQDSMRMIYTQIDFSTSEAIDKKYNINGKSLKVYFKRVRGGYVLDAGNTYTKDEIIDFINSLSDFLKDHERINAFIEEINKR